MFFSIFQIFFIAFEGILKAIWQAIISLLPAINQLNEIAGAFSWISIIAGILGISTIVLIIIKHMIKYLAKN